MEEDEEDYFFVYNEEYNFEAVFEQEQLFYDETFSDCFRSLPDEKNVNFKTPSKLRLTYKDIIEFGKLPEISMPKTEINEELDLDFAEKTEEKE